MREWLSSFSGVLPAQVIRAVQPYALDDATEEIRIRINRPIQLLSAGNREQMIPIYPDERLCGLILEMICAHSVYARERELSECYVTLPNGSRVGICGQADETGRITMATSFNIRIAREVKGCAAGLLGQILGDSGPISTLIFSEPGVGKTTVLRDLARILSDGEGLKRAYKVAVADERGEIAACERGVATLDVGKRTDVLDGCDKSIAIKRLVRAMSPEVIITDEIGSQADAETLADAVRCGVCVIASAHARDRETLLHRPHLQEIVYGGVFARFIRLTRRERKVVTEAYGAEEMGYDKQNRSLYSYGGMYRVRANQGLQAKA